MTSRHWSVDTISMTEPEQSNLSPDLVPSFVRTAVPLVVGPLIAKLGFDPNSSTVLLEVSAVSSWLFYAVVRFLELKKPFWGYLLGVAKAPSYAPPVADSAPEAG